MWLACRSLAAASIRVRRSFRVRNGLGITIVSTPRGVLSDAEARDAQRRRRSAGGGVLMSRIGKRPVAIPGGVTATIDGAADA
jgi:hypothetical protein